MNTEATSRKRFMEDGDISCDSLDVSGFFSDSDDEPQTNKPNVEKKATTDVKKHVSVRIPQGVQWNNHHIISSTPLPGKEFVLNTGPWPSPIPVFPPLLRKEKDKIGEGCKDKASSSEIEIISSEEENELISKKESRLKRKKTVSNKLKTDAGKRYPSEVEVHSGSEKCEDSHKTATKSEKVSKRVHAELNQPSKDIASSSTKSNMKPGYRIKSNISADGKLQLHKSNEYEFIPSGNDEGKEADEELTSYEKPNLSQRNKKLSKTFSEDGATAREASKRYKKCKQVNVKKETGRTKQSADTDTVAGVEVKCTGTTQQLREKSPKESVSNTLLRESNVVCNSNVEQDSRSNNTFPLLRTLQKVDYKKNTGINEDESLKVMKKQERFVEISGKENENKKIPRGKKKNAPKLKTQREKRLDKVSDGGIQRNSGKMPGVRRSQRKRMKPVAFWIGERIQYRTDADFCREVVGIKPGVPASNWKGPIYSAHVKKLVHVIAPIVQPNTSGQLPRRKLIKIPYEGNECEIECFSTPRFELDTTQDENFAVITCLEVPGMTSGYVELGPLFESEEQIIPSNMNLVFCIIRGNLIVKIHNVTRSMQKNESFFIPKGVFYKLKNTNRNKTLLSYTKYES